ncbi:MAG: hypothetical protein PHP64_07160 [Actinomycetota bacterium]|nr:hypothetical protein [Actinomycetota bacterium]
MRGIPVCRACRVPKRVSNDLVWNSDGTITQKRDPEHRLIFFESAAIDQLFPHIENLIGMPIDKIVIEGKARATRAYMEKSLLGIQGPLARLIGLGRIIQTVITQAKIMGYGKTHIKEFSWTKRYLVAQVENPYSLYLFCGDLLGAIEAVRRQEGNLSWEQVEPGKYEMRVFHAPHPPELSSRLMLKTLPRKNGDIELNRCPDCKLPLEISNSKWDLENGIIKHKDSGVRMAIFGPLEIQSIFDELAAELGEDIPRIIIEAQRMYTLSHMRPEWKNANKTDMRKWLALQGLGNLVDIEKADEGASVLIENPAIPLLTTGVASALYEFRTKRPCSYNWKITPDGVLSIDLMSS